MEETKSKCPKCRCWRKNEDFIKKDKVLKTCDKCRENNMKSSEKNKCEHGRVRGYCVDCGGSQICEHKRVRGSCIECGGTGICEHGRRRSQCVECGGNQICEHGRQRSQCVDCGGSQICEHGRQKSRCIECGGTGICEHGRRRSQCVECGSKCICEHGRRISQCVECDGSQICEHKRIRQTCQICNFNQYLIKKQRNHIKRCFQYTSLKKTKSSIKYLGCDINIFISHMEKKLTEGMTWDNIHIDHIKPVSRFNLDIEEEFNKCCHYTNLQPLLAKDNLNKHNKWTDENDKYWNENIIYKEYDKIYL